jgi:hypothetical protein
MSGGTLHPGRDTPESDSDDDGLGRLTMALAGYIEEVNDYRDTCLRHEEATVVTSARKTLSLLRLFPLTDAAREHVRNAAERLPGWERSLFWAAEKKACMDLRRRTSILVASEAGDVVVTRGISWAGRPVLVSATSTRDGRFLQVNLLIPEITEDLVELPLRRVAHGLGCHEYLLPESIARPVPRSKHRPDSLPLRAYLTRAMPPSLYASQCLWPGGAGE